ncbi:MAG: hypothetical protein AAF501_14125, partial [Pseudomonadota bacterium]
MIRNRDRVLPAQRLGRHQRPASQEHAHDIPEAARHRQPGKTGTAIAARGATGSRTPDHIIRPPAMGPG